MISSEGKWLKMELDYAMIDSLDIDELIVMKKKERFLAMHPYAIWQSKDGKCWYTTFPDSSKPRGVRQIHRKSKLELNKAIIEYWESCSNKNTIQDVFNDWNDTKLELNKIGELTHLRNEQLFSKHFSGIANQAIEETTPETFADFLEKQLAEFSLTSKAFGNLKTIVRGIVKWARKKRYIEYTDYDVFGILDVSDRAFKKVVKENDEEVFDDVETPIIINYLCENLDLRNLGILLLFVTGLRVGELVALRNGDFVDNLVKVRRMEVRIPNPDGGSIYEIRDFPKTEAGVRDVIIPTDCLWIVDKLRKSDPDSYVFLNEKGQRMTTNTIRKRLYYVCDKLNLKHKSPHKIRKTYGSILLDNNLDNKFVQEQMGHSDIRCTEKHYHISRRTQKEKSEIIDHIPDFKGMHEGLA